LYIRLSSLSIKGEMSNILPDHLSSPLSISWRTTLISVGSSVLWYKSIPSVILRTHLLNLPTITRSKIYMVSIFWGSLSWFFRSPEIHSWASPSGVKKLGIFYSMNSINISAHWPHIHFSLQPLQMGFIVSSNVMAIIWSIILSIKYLSVSFVDLSNHCLFDLWVSLFQSKVLEGSKVPYFKSKVNTQTIAWALWQWLSWFPGAILEKLGSKTMSLGSVDPAHYITFLGNRGSSSTRSIESVSGYSLHSNILGVTVAFLNYTWPQIVTAMLIHTTLDL